MGEPVKIEGDVGERLVALLSRLENPGPMLEALGRLGQQSVRTTFARGGRPGSWSPPKYREGQRGRLSGRLQASFGAGQPGEIFELGSYSIAFGTNVVYAPTQNFGAKRGEFGTHTVTVPAHERNTKHGPVYVRGHQRTQQIPWGPIEPLNFLKLLPEDIADFEEVVEEFIMNGEVG